MKKKKNKKQNVGKSLKTLTNAANLGQEPVNDTHAAVIDAYFINGFQKTAAMMEVNPDLDYNTAAVMANAIFSNERNAMYLQMKRSQLRATTDIRNENVLRELINWAYCDATQFMLKSEAEIQALPPDIRRCIQSFKSYTKTSIDRSKTKHVTTTLEIKLVDKKTAIEAIGKHIGFFLLDNEQKRTKINLEKVDINILNGFLDAVEYQDMDQ